MTIRWHLAQWGERCIKSLSSHGVRGKDKSLQREREMCAWVEEERERENSSRVACTEERRQLTGPDQVLPPAKRSPRRLLRSRFCSCSAFGLRRAAGLFDYCCNGEDTIHVSPLFAGLQLQPFSCTWTLSSLSSKTQPILAHIHFQVQGNPVHQTRNYRTHTRTHTYLALFAPLSLSFIDTRQQLELLHFIVVLVTTAEAI